MLLDFETKHQYIFSWIQLYYIHFVTYYLILSLNNSQQNVVEEY